MRAYVQRIVEHELVDGMRQHPAILLVGPRASGKTTTARRHVASVVRLDRPAEAAAFEADADAALRRLEEPILLDEWQAVPGVLAAVKRSVDDDRRPGRYLLTGSVRAELHSETWPGTGRLVRLRMDTLSRRELAGRSTGASSIDLIASGNALALAPAAGSIGLPRYVEMAIEGGFPEAVLHLEGRARERWLEGYVDQLLTRDAIGSSRRDPARLNRYFEVLALNTAGIVTNSTIYEAAHVDRKTSEAYDRLLSDLFILDLVPAWAKNRLTRLVKTPKRYITDSSLVGATLRTDVGGVLRDGNLLGRMLDTFVVAQLRPEFAASVLRPRVFHLREKSGRHELDLLAELGGDRVFAFEVKATAAPKRRDAAHLEWIRDQMGERFLAGVVFHTGPDAFRLAERITALPIASLWARADLA